MPLIPRGALVYISTDDPDGLCENCYVERKPCTAYTVPKPPGCPDDVSGVVSIIKYTYLHMAGYSISYPVNLKLYSMMW